MGWPFNFGGQRWDTSETNTLELHYISSRGDKALPKVYHPFLLLKKWAIGPALRGHIQLGMTCL